MTISLHDLHRSTGSATVSEDGYTILCAVHGPQDPAQRRDELPNEAYIDVSIQPHEGVAHTRERYLERLISKVIGDTVLVTDMPRSAVQVAIQILQTPYRWSESQGKSVRSRESTRRVSTVDRKWQDLPMLPTLLHVTSLALLDATIPMRCTFNTTMLAITFENEILIQPNAALLDEARSIHVFTSDSYGKLILVQSEGEFELQAWTRAEQEAQKLNKTKQEALKQRVEGEVLRNLRWRGG